MNKNILIVIIILILVVVAGFILWNQEGRTNNSEGQNNSLNNYQIEGMQVEIIKEGAGEGAKTGDAVSVHYTGTLQNGTKFDSSLDRNEPFEYTLGQNRVIQGWEKGLLGMKKGEKRKLVIPPELAYGPDGFPPVIPQNATLIFEIEMLSINAK